MPREALLSVRMDSDLKESVEQLYRNLGTSFAEAVRIFARQSVAKQGLPLEMPTERRSAEGMLAKYANPELRNLEADAFSDAMVEKYAQTY